MWLTWRIVGQDRALEQQTLRDRVERAADLIVAGIERDLARLEDDVAASPAAAVASSADALVVSFAGDRVTVSPPGRLLYYPSAAPVTEPPAGVFERGEMLEFQARDHAAAIRVFRALARSADPTVRAGALVRLARNLRKAAQPDRALAAYDDLARLGDVPVAGVPAELLAREARCALLAELRRAAELVREATALHQDLAHARWRLDRTAYAFHAGRVRQWLAGAGVVVVEDDTLLALAGAVERLWADRQRGGRDEVTAAPARDRESLWIDGVPVAVLRRASRNTLTALVAGPRFVEVRLGRAWMNERVSVSLVDADGHRVVGAPLPTGVPNALRSAQDSRLPWTLRVGSADSAAQRAQLAGRRRLLLSGLALTALLTILGGYFTARATARELAVARRESDFVAAVSHEFRTPLTSLRHLTELLERGGVASEDRRRQYYAVMARETERLHRMVERLLDFGRMEAGRREYAFESVDAVELVESAVDEFRADIAASGRQVECVTSAVAAHQRRVRVDREAIGHALRNLLENAVQYSIAPAPVRVDLDDGGDQIAIRVRDEGIGIPAAEQGAIFGKFVRGSASRALNVRGTGVGLAMVRHIVRAHRGDVKVESEPGRGSTFTILLPASADGATIAVVPNAHGQLA